MPYSDYIIVSSLRDSEKRTVIDKDFIKLVIGGNIILFWMYYDIANTQRIRSNIRCNKSPSIIDTQIGTFLNMPITQLPLVKQQKKHYCV